MGLLRNLADWFDPEKRSFTLKDPFYAERYGLGTQTGQMVTPDRASGVATVHACVQLIAETTATLPLAPYRRLSDGDRVVDRDHSLYGVLHEQANKIQTATEFREQFVASCLLTGNGYAEKIVAADGSIRELIPLHPDTVAPEKLVNGRVRYQVRDGNSRTLTQDEVLHLRYRSRDGYTGISPIQIARETIGMALAHQEHEGAFYRNGLTTSAVITAPNQLRTDQLETMHESLERGWSRGNKFRALILSAGLDFKPISMSHEDAQFVESKKLNLEDLCRIFRVPPPAVGILDRATYSNITEQSRHLVAYCLRPWLVRIEQAMNLALLSEDGRRTHFIEHNAEGLLRGALTERFQAYEIGKKNGWMSANEIRQLENMNHIEGGDEYSPPQRAATK